MDHKMVFTVQSGIFVLAGLVILIIPQQLISDLGLSLEQGGVGIARLYGATMIMLAVITWMARESGPSTARRAIVLGLFVGNSLTAVVGIYNGLAGGFGTVIWAGVIVWLLMALDFGVLYFKESNDR